MSTRRIPWIIKYRPRRLADIVDQDEAKKTLAEWLAAWRKGKPPSKKAALLYGPAGVGKTSLVEALANELGYELVEMNASDFRRKSDIERVARTAALQSTLFAKGKIILLDEIDGLSSMADKGALDALLGLIEDARHPVIMTANDPWSPQLRPLRDLSLMIRFKRIPKTQVAAALKRICAAENIECEDAALKYIAEKSEGDLRSAINDLQSIAEVYGRVSLRLAQLLVRPRDRQYDPFEVLRSIFISKYAWQARQAVTHSTVDYEMLMEWLNENIPVQLPDPSDRWRAYEALSRASIYLSRIKRSGSWDLLSYVFDMIGPAVAFSRQASKYRWVKYSFPQRILLMAKTKRTREVREALASLLAGRLHTSKSTVKSDVLPFLRVIFRSNPHYAARITRAYQLTEDMVSFLAGGAAREILRLARAPRSLEEYR